MRKINNIYYYPINNDPMFLGFSPDAWLQSIFTFLGVIAAIGVVFWQIIYDKKKEKKKESNNYYKGCESLKFILLRSTNSNDVLSSYVLKEKFGDLFEKLKEEHLKRIKQCENEMNQLMNEFIPAEIFAEFIRTKTIFYELNMDLASFFGGLSVYQDDRKIFSSRIKQINLDLMEFHNKLTRIASKYENKK